MDKINIGLESKALKTIIKLLSVTLADTYVLYLKTQNFHWNIIDPRFASLHKFLEEQYEALAEAVDEVAERIRKLGGRSPGSFKQFLELATLKEQDSDHPVSGDEMLKILLQDHESVIRNLRKGIEEANGLHDDGTGDLLIDNIRFHEKAAWMIRSHFPQ